MTSSLRSRFSLADRRALCLAGDKAIVHHWSSGALAESYVFDATDSGLGLFERYLAQSPGMPVHMLVDVVEEEYRQDTIPHVFGKDRRSLIERKIGRLFRGTTYTHAVAQGRETEGRRDDRLLLTALLNPALVQPWVDVLARHKVPLAGICSLPLLSANLLKRLGVKDDNVLLVTLQSASGLRQSFFRGGELRVSRLARMPRLGTVPFAEHVVGELDKLRRYLNSLRVMARESPLDIYIVSQGEPLESLRASCIDSDQTRYHMLDAGEVADALGISAVTPTPYADRIFAHLLLSGGPVNHYASAQETRYHTMHSQRNGLLAASVVLALAGVGLSGFNFMEAVALKQEAEGALDKARFYQARYDMAREKLPRTVVESEDIQRAVQLVDELEAHRAEPALALATVSRALDGFPLLRLDRIAWQAGADPETPVEGESPPARENTREAVSEPVARTTGAKEYDYYQIALVGGRVEPFDGDYRRALGEVNRFAESLRAQAAVHSVSVLELPLDVTPDGRVEGSAAATQERREARFAIKVVVGMDDGAS